MRRVLLGLLAVSCLGRPRTQTLLSRDAGQLLGAAMARLPKTNLSGWGEYQAYIGLMKLRGKFAIVWGPDSVGIIMKGPLGASLGEVWLPGLGQSSLPGPDSALCRGDVCVIFLDTIKVSLRAETLLSVQTPSGGLAMEEWGPAGDGYLPRKLRFWTGDGEVVLTVNEWRQ